MTSHPSAPRVRSGGGPAFSSDGQTLPEMHTSPHGARNHSQKRKLRMQSAWRRAHGQGQTRMCRTARTRPPTSEVHIPCDALWFRVSTEAPTKPTAFQSWRAQRSKWFFLLTVLCISYNPLNSDWHPWLSVPCHYFTTHYFEVSEVSTRKRVPTSDSHELCLPHKYNLLLNHISMRNTKVTKTLALSENAYPFPWL